MTTRNAILLIVKQNPGIDYNSLLNKFASSYSNANSARAALSRSLKDLTIFGLVTRKQNRYYLMDKGEGEIYSEIKNKLVLALNATLKEKHPVDKIDSVVEKLQILIERGRSDRDLLKTAKSSLDFSISDLEGICGELEKKVRHLEYISKVFSDQIKSLKDLEFNDSFARQSNPVSFTKLNEIFSSQPDSELMVECQDPALLEILALGFLGKVKNNSFPVQKSQLQILPGVFEKSALRSIKPVNIFSSVLKAQVYPDIIILSGPVAEVEKWKKD